MQNEIDMKIASNACWHARRAPAQAHFGSMCFRAAQINKIVGISPFFSHPQIEHTFFSPTILNKLQICKSR